MNITRTTEEFENNCKANIKELCDLFKAYDLAELGYKMQEEQINDIYNAVLAANPFYASEDCKRAGIKAGDRITSEESTFLLSDEEFNRLTTLTTKELAKAGITDEQSYYITDWLGAVGEARRALVGFILANLLPEEVRTQFNTTRMNITHEHKIIDIFRPMINNAI